MSDLMNGPEVPAPPRKRWKKILIISGSSVLGLVLLVILFGPLIVAAIAKSKIISLLEEELQADVSIQDVSFDWSGHLAFGSLRVVPRGFADPLLQVKEIRAKVSLGAAIRGKYIADVVIDTPQILIEKGPDGNLNFDVPPASPKPKKVRDRKPGEEAEPIVQATLNVWHGSVRIRAGGREMLYESLGLEAKVDTLAKKVDCTLSLPGVGTAKAIVSGGFDWVDHSSDAMVVFKGIPLRTLTGGAWAGLEGTATGRIQFRTKQAPAFSIRSLVEIRSFGAVIHDRAFRLNPLSVILNGAFDEKGTGRHDIEISAGKVTGGTITVDVIEAFTAPAATAELRLSGDLLLLAETLRGAGVPLGEAKPEGPVSLRGIVKYRSSRPDEPDGTLTLDQVQITSNAIKGRLDGALRRVTGEHREGELALEASVLPAGLSKWIPDLNLEGPEVRFTATAALKPGLMTFKGRTQLEDLKGKTQKAKTAPIDFLATLEDKEFSSTLQTAAFEWIDAGYSAKGGLASEIRWKGDVATGTTKFTNLEVRDEKKNVVKELALTIVHEIGLPPHAMEFRKLEVASTFVKGSVVGKVVGLDKDPELQGVHAAFKYLPDKLGAVLAPWLPGKLEGAEEKSLDIQLDGKVKSAELLALLRGARGSVDVDLARFTMTGMSVSGKTKLDLKDGRMTSGTPLDVNKGKADLQASLDFREPFDPAGSTGLTTSQGRPGPAVRPRSTFDFRARDVDANAHMGPMLETINPIFHTVNGVLDGQIQSDFKLVWDGKLDPTETDPDKWIAAASQSLQGGGVFAVKSLNIAGSPLVAEIMAVLGEGNQLKGELLGTDVRIANGRCEYTNMTLKLARYELRFTGWVDFRKHMELMVEMPMTEGMIKKYPGLARYTGKTLFVPLRGKTDSPRLDFQKAIGEILKRVAENVLEDKARQLLEDLLKKKKKKD